VFPEKEGEKIDSQITLMADGHSAPSFESNVTCITNTNNEVYCGLKILGMPSSSDNTVESFVMIIRDEGDLLEQQRAAEDAKSISESLLLQILPHDIVLRLNQGEKDISFSVPNASIIFIDIVKFSQYSAMLPPKETLEHLSLLFSSFDAVGKRYSLLTKIKLIGDMYIASTGLFAPEGSAPEDHAVQIVTFGLDCILELEHVNMRLSASLEVRTGVNSGGPIVAGILGSDRPLFDIIGDAINVAARLQTTCLPGKVQIPRSTLEFIEKEGFNVEERGTVFLKGKGETMTYLVSPSHLGIYDRKDPFACSAEFDVSAPAFEPESRDRVADMALKRGTDADSKK
jgi:class 3 adenylate cyclase